HGYFRTRAELFHNFALGRIDPTPLFWPQPADNSYQDLQGTVHNVALCAPDPTDTKSTAANCSDNTQAGANMRFRISPELHISDNLRVMAQLDLLDNVVLGSTPEGYYNIPSQSAQSVATNGYTVAKRGGYSPLGVFSNTQWTPVANSNSSTNS